MSGLLYALLALGRAAEHDAVNGTVTVPGHIATLMQWFDQHMEDAARFHWLTTDHDDPRERMECRRILACMPVISYSAACMDIDATRKEFGHA